MLMSLTVSRACPACRASTGHGLSACRARISGAPPVGGQSRKVAEFGTVADEVLADNRQYASDAANDSVTDIWRAASSRNPNAGHHGVCPMGAPQPVGFLRPRFLVSCNENSWGNCHHRIDLLLCPADVQHQQSNCPQLNSSNCPNWRAHAAILSVLSSARGLFWPVPKARRIRPLRPVLVLRVIRWASGA